MPPSGLRGWGCTWAVRGRGRRLLPRLARPRPAVRGRIGRALAAFLAYRHSFRRPVPRTSGCRCLGSVACLHRIGRGMVCRMGNILRAGRPPSERSPSLLAWLGLYGPAGWRRACSLLALCGVGLSLASSGHASAASPQWLTRPAVFLHAVGVAYWIGALIPLAVIVRKAPSDALPIVRRFSSGALVAVAMLSLDGTCAGGHPGGGIREPDRDRLWARPDRQDAPCHGPARPGGPEPPVADACAWRHRRRPAGHGSSGRSGPRSSCAWPFWRPSGCGASPRRRGRSRLPPTAAASASVHLHSPRVMAQVTLSPGRVGNTRAQDRASRREGRSPSTRRR